MNNHSHASACSVPCLSLRILMLTALCALLCSRAPAGMPADTLRLGVLPDSASWQAADGAKAPDSRAGGPGFLLNAKQTVRFFSRSTQPFFSARDAAFCRLLWELPENLPTGTQITVYMIDHDFLWWQHTGLLQPEMVLPLTGLQAVRFWKPEQHQRHWHDRVPASLREWGFMIHPTGAAPSPLPVEIRLKEASLWKHADPGPLKMTGLNWLPRMPETGRKMEMFFQLNRLPVSPFDPEALRIDCILTMPNGQQQSVRCFYYEDFLYDPDERDKTRCLSPWGSPQFRMRFTPLMPGRYGCAFSIVLDNGSPVRLQGPSFTVEDGGPFPGFVRPDPAHPLHLQYDSGEAFLGLGMNVRSPYDNRYKTVAPYSLWEDRGLQAYEHLFRKYEKAGINVAEIWMCSWWLALEWIPDAPGFHGVGHYNQYRAWMLDHIVNLAEKHHIHLILVFNNHGKFGMTFDTEWKRNPYNRANGGFLDKCEDYYTSDKARTAFRNTADYIVARWGYSPRILMWKLFTEVDLTGPGTSFYHHPSVAAWHREMGDYLHRIDPHRRMVTTHWMLGYHRINDAIATLPQMDCLTTDAYYESGGSASLVRMLREGAARTRKWKKPLVITEFGGSSYADNMGNLMKQVELGLWTGFFNNYSILPMNWWFALIEDKDLYHYYRALADFARGEDRRTMIPGTRQQQSAGGRPLEIAELRAPAEVLLWIYDRNFFHTSDENARPPKIDSTQISIPALQQKGPCRAEYRDTADGRILGAETLLPQDAPARLRLQLPAFRRSLAVKIRPAD